MLDPSLFSRGGPLPALLWLGAALTAQSPFLTHPPALAADRLAGARAVTLEQCREWVHTLASPEFAGRQTGTPGYLKAAEFVSTHFEALGLEARGPGGSYYQHVPWSTTGLVDEKCSVTFTVKGEQVLRVPANRLAGWVSASQETSGDVVLLVVEPPPRPVQQANRRSFKVPEIPGLSELAVEGKVVLAYLKPTDDRRDFMTRLAIMRQLAGKQPAALLFAQDSPPPSGLTPRATGSRGRNPAARARGRQPAEVILSTDDLKKVLAASGTSPEVLAADEFTPAFTASATVELAVEEQQAPAMNVWAVLPGSDPALCKQYVVVGSHLDHIGTRGGLHPGADDDASGTCGVMALARMFVENPVKPRRSILFVCFAGEEDGLIGSRFFVRNPPIPLSSIVAELQMDMIGRDEEANSESRTKEERAEKAEDNRDSLHLVGSRKLAPALHELCLAKNDAAGFAIEYDQEGMFSRSDHANFARVGIPVAFFFTGLHRDYHRTTDTPDKIHYEKLLRVTTYVYDIAFTLSQREDRPLVDPELWDEMPGAGSRDAAAPTIKDK